MKSVLIFQMLHHPFDNCLKSIREMDFTDLRVDIMQAIYNSKEGSVIIPPEEYDFSRTPDATAEWFQNKLIAQREKTAYAKKLCLDNNYDYVLFAADDVVAPEYALKLLLAEEKDFISALVNQERDPDAVWKFAGRIYDPDGPQASDDRPIEPERDFKFGDVIPITWGVTVFFLISKNALSLVSDEGLAEREFWKWLSQNKIQPYIHTGVMVNYFGSP